MSEFIYRRERVSDGVWSAENTGEEIIRCGDCACFDNEGEYGQWCTQLDFGKKEIADGFCAWAVRRDA